MFSVHFFIEVWMYLIRSRRQLRRYVFGIAVRRNCAVFGIPSGWSTTFSFDPRLSDPAPCASFRGVAVPSAGLSDGVPRVPPG